MLGKRTLVMIKSTPHRSIHRAQVHNLIARNVVELIELPSGRKSVFVKVVRAAKGRDGAAHAATDTGELACAGTSRTGVTWSGDLTGRTGSPRVPWTAHGRPT